MRWKREFISFLISIVCGGNPANGVEKAPWRKEVAEQLLSHLEKEGPYWTWSSLVQWAVVEWLNEGSHMRASCPFTLRGTGRWLANDCGGRYNVLREKILKAVEQPHVHHIVGVRFLAAVLGRDPLDYEWDEEHIKDLLSWYLYEYQREEEAEEEIEIEEPLDPNERLEEWGDEG